MKDDERRERYQTLIDVLKYLFWLLLATAFVTFVPEMLPMPEWWTLFDTLILLSVLAANGLIIWIAWRKKRG